MLHYLDGDNGQKLSQLRTLPITRETIKREIPQAKRIVKEVVREQATSGARKRSSVG